jgi:hypothetical protein
MSFLRHARSIPRWSHSLGYRAQGEPRRSRLPRVTHRYDESAEYSWRVALQQSPLPLPRPAQCAKPQLTVPIRFQRTVYDCLALCLTLGVHPISCANCQLLIAKCCRFLRAKTDSRTSNLGVAASCLTNIDSALECSLRRANCIAAGKRKEDTTRETSACSFACPLSLCRGCGTGRGSRLHASLSAAG